MFAEYFFLGILLVASSLIGGYMFIAARVHPGLKAVLSVVMVALSIWQWITLNNDILGYPVRSMIPDQAILTYFTADQQLIYIWVTTDDNSEPRAYAVPFDAKFYEELKERAKHAWGNGKYVRFIRGSEHEGQYRLKEQQLLPPKGPPMEDD